MAGRTEGAHNDADHAGEFLRKFRPLGGTVVLRRDPSADRVGSILIPEAYRDDSRDKKHPLFYATVLKVGPGPWSQDGRRRVDPVVKPGDRVLVGRWGAEELKHVKDLGVRNIFTMNALDIIAVID